MFQVPVYQVYQEDQDQISDATYICDVVFQKKKLKNIKIVGSKLIIVHPFKDSFDRETMQKKVNVSRKSETLFLLKNCDIARGCGGLWKDF